MITQQAWMFTKTYEKLRKKLDKVCIVNLIQLGKKAFDEIKGEVVQVASFVISNIFLQHYSGEYVDLTNGNNELEKEKCFQEKSAIYEAIYSDFSNVPNASMMYWLSRNALLCFKYEKLGEKAVAREGMTTADNDRFLRNWYEIEWPKLGLKMQSLEEAKKTKYKWFPYNKGGVNRKWYGNMEYVINWENNGYEVRNIKDLVTGRIRSHNYNGEYSFRESGTWTAICSGEIMVRYSCVGALFDSKGASVFAKDNEELLYIIGLLNSKVSGIFLRGLSPAYEFKVGHIANVPFIAKETTNVTRFVRENINLSKKDWDSFEVSWDFRKHVLVQPVIRISEAFIHWKSECISRFEQVKLNEEELNHIFIDTYELHEELSPKVGDNNVTIRKADLRRDIKSLISYAVGCMFGRYSLDVEGLAYAGGEWDSSKYSTFIPDKDNCIPITDKRYFDDDIVVLFEKWLIAVYGEDTLEQNLDFVAEALDNKGSSSRDIIRNYFLNDFFKDHCATYSVTGSGKRPIYWLFDSGKQNGFKALIYMHRYNEDTVGRVLIYLQKLQDKYETEVRAIDAMLEHITDQRQAAAEEKRREHLRRQIEEVRDYDERLEHMANERVGIDLDDGVKVNYEKVQTDREGKKYQILAAIK